MSKNFNLKRETVYFCQECKKSIEHLEKLLLIEEEMNHAFCSEECLLKFFKPRIIYFENKDRDVLKSLDLKKNQKLQKYLEQETLLEELLNDPDELWKEQNDLGEVYYTHISHFKENDEEFTMIAICYHFEAEPSFILFKTISQSPQHTRYYRVGNSTNTFDQKPSGQTIEFESDSDMEVEENIDIAPETIEMVEHKKSTFLAHLLQNRSEEDIDYENFSHYEKKLGPTLEGPDEVFKATDEEGDILLTYVKSYQEKNNKKTFFYIVVCLMLEEKTETQEDILIPIISFPSVDSELYLKYAQGERVNQTLKN